MHNTGLANGNQFSNMVKTDGIVALGLNKLLGHVQDSIGGAGQRNVATAISERSMKRKIKLP